MDNFHFDMTCEGNDALSAALLVVFRATGNEGAGPRGQKRGATHYAIRPGQDKKSTRMVFFNYIGTPSDHVKLPFTLDAAGAAEFARRWLVEAEYGREPDHDGDNGRGWRLYNEGWGHVDGEHGAIIAVAPAWAMYGK